MKPTFQGFIEQARDALILIEAVMHGLLQPVRERPSKSLIISHGDIFVFNKTHAKIKRWTDRWEDLARDFNNFRMNWGRSRGAGLFFYYKQAAAAAPSRSIRGRANEDDHFDKTLVKKTISCQSEVTGEVWHVISYYNPDLVFTLPVPSRYQGS